MTAFKFEVGKEYESKNGDAWICIAINGKGAWLARHDTGNAYFWDINGKSVSLSANPGCYDIALPPREFSAWANEDGRITLHNDWVGSGWTRRLFREVQP